MPISELELFITNREISQNNFNFNFNLFHKMKILFYFLSILTFAANAGGILITKEQSFHSDTSAKVILYHKLIADNANTQVYINGKQHIIPNSYYRRWCPLFTLENGNIDNNYKLANIQNELNQMLAFAKRFPQSETHFRPYIDIHQTAVTNGSRGLIRINGKWISKQTYEKMIADQILAEKNKKEEMLKMEQAAKALKAKQESDEREAQKIALANKKSSMLKDVKIREQQLNEDISITEEKISKTIQEFLKNL